uniref:ATP synthase protein I n=1 Tax=Candidatus Kentrum sp. TC TaxID=2126339 RepID=A0A450YVT2_9GAMM|nr:MAG: ATP synthase protein I [Candidatus Kentron sp. TC]VFK49335.1 MAG: ATP synthase protein I [Candidatus Kentron sp. TC]VFK53362.1 MAG: ATP synthase protein I [Candidatus Kentron sp. TC]
MAIFTIWMLVMRTRLAKKIAEDMPNQEVRVLYVGAIQRFASMLVLFVVGMAILRLDPVSLLSGFVVSLAGGVLGAYLYVLYFGVR